MYFAIITWVTATYLYGQGWAMDAAVFAGCGIAAAVMSAGAWLVVRVVQVGAEKGRSERR